MGRKSRYDRRNKPGSSSYGKKKWEDEPRRGRSPTRSPTPDRRRDESPYPRRQHRIDETRAQSPSPPRGRGYTTSRYSPEYEGRPSSSAYARNISRSPSPLRRREYSRPPSEEYRRGERYTSVERPYVSRASRSRSPSPSREKSTPKKFRNKKSRYDKKSIKSRDTDKYSKSSRRTHDVWKPGQKNGSPQPSRGRAWSPQDSSPQRSLSPSPRRDRPSTSGSGRPSYNSRTSISPAYDRPSRRQAPSELAQSSTSRYPPLPDQRDLYQEVRSTDYTRKHPPSQSSRHKSPIPSRKYEEYPSQDHDNRDYENRDYEKRRQERRKRPRGQDYSREEWEKTHDSRKRYDEPKVQDNRYYSDIPEEPRSSYEKYPTLPESQYSQYSESRDYVESGSQRRTPQGPRAQYEEPYRESDSYERRRNSLEQIVYPPSDPYPIVPSPPILPPVNDDRYGEGYRNERPRHKESRRSSPPPPRDATPPRLESIPPTQGQNGLRNAVNIVSPPPPPPPPPSDLPASAPTGPRVNGGIRPFTLKGKVLKNLKRAHEPDLETDRLFKSIRTSPRHVSAPAPVVMPPPPPTVEIQQTQTPETPSNREGVQERRPPIKEKSASMFERIGQVGEGTYGKVYKARNTLTGELVALKKIRMESERDGFPITAMREIKLLESLRHTNVVHLQEMMFEKSYIYMVFEYLDHDLAGILTHPHFTFRPSHIKELLRQMLEGLHYLHHRGILHRDIKGSNILLSAEGQLKLADFGLARHYHKHRANLDYSNRVITLWYRPPELLLGATAYGPGVDIWSIGCIMLEMVTKKALFPGTDEIDQLLRIWNIMGTPTSETWPKVTELPWWELVKPQTFSSNRFHQDFANVLSKEGLDLASKLLSLNPDRRPTAAEALEHPYFTSELPKPERPTGLVLDGEWHEFESKQRKRAHRAQEHRKGTQSTVDSHIQSESVDKRSIA